MALRGIYTIPAGWPFVDALAAGILDEIGPDPASLADVTILLPTRRAVRSLREAFLRLSEGRPLLLPRMMPLGDIDEDELVIAGADELSGGGLDIPPAFSGLRRQLLLARLVRHAQPALPVEQAAMLALELGKLIDRVRTERLSFDRLSEIVPEEHAEHWQQTIKFLKIVTTHWPEILAGEGAIDSADRRNRLLAAEAERWRRHPPQGLVIAAGSTGSIPATADLLGVIPELPRGVLVLPGFDPAITPGEVEAALGDVQHPQHGMLRLLARLDEPGARVRAWPKQPARITHPDRARLLAEVMRPAETTPAWRSMSAPSTAALTDVSRIDCPGADEEARVIALLMRETLQTSAKTAALVTPDRTLARRVAAELRRWNIEIDDSAGYPLATTPVGAFLRLAAELVAQDFAPVALLNFAKHPLAACGMAPADVRRLIRRLEIAILRGPRPGSGISGLRAAMRASSAGKDRELMNLLDAIEAASTPFATLAASPRAQFAELVAAHIRMTEALACSDTEMGADRLWSGDAGEAAASFVSETIEAAGALGEIPPAAYCGLIDALLGGRVVRPSYGAHPRLFIWGLLEARLQHADIMILGGLNEGTWPPDGEADPWMSRPMRKAFGLPAPERRIGLTAHDFAQAYSAPEVILTRAQRVDGTPTVPSRWLVKLEKILTKFGVFPSERNARQWLDWQALLDKPEIAGSRPDRRPAPKPPVSARPRQLSVTQIETWMRDPYSIYARHILRLKELEPLDAAPDRADYGTIIHRVLDDFIRAHPTALPADAYQALHDLGTRRFGEQSVPPGVRAFWWPRFLRIARWIADSEPERRIGLSQIASEVNGAFTIDGPAGPFKVTAIADRVDRMSDGSLRIFDYKTGAAPSPKEVAAGFSPQLPLEAMIAMAGGFTDIAKGDVSALAFLRLSGGNPAGEEKSAANKDSDPKRLVEEARDGLIGLVTSFDNPDTPYEARPRPDMAPRYSAYEHLARVKEWAAGPDGEGGES